VRAETRRRIEAARAQAEYLDRKPNGQAVTVVPPVVSSVLVDEMMAQAKWWTFSEIREKFEFSYDTVSRGFRGREGVLKVGSDYRVSDATLRKWLAEALAKGLKAA